MRTQALALSPIFLLLACSEYAVKSNADDPVDPPPEEGAPDIAVSPLALSFGVLPSGSVSEPQVVTVTNEGDATLVLSGAELASGGPFQVTSLGALVLDPGADTTFAVTFEPMAPGAALGEVLVASNPKLALPKRAL
jgi:non-ribosomal peptide synthetase component F